MVHENNQKNNQVLLHLSLISGVGPAAILKILKGVFLESYPELLHVSLMEIIDAQEHLNLETIYHYSTHDFMHQCDISEKIGRVLVEGLKDKTLLQKELALLEKYSICVVTVLQSMYPDILKQIHLPPTVLYYRGGEFLSQAKRLAIVGSRKADSYAHDVIKALVPGLIAHNWHIVSGGADGVDTMAHEATLDAGGKTIVVMGSGFLHPYPESNKDLFKRVVQNNGIIVSPFPLNTPPDKGTFPARNRVISGLAQGCLIVRAAERSGALITAQFALEQGRLIFAVPGSVHEQLSIGCHDLIQQGAKLVHSAQDILEEFGEWSAHEKNSDTQEHNEQVLTFTGAQAGVKSNGEKPHTLIDFLDHSRTLDELSELTGIEYFELQHKLFELQLEGKIRQTFNGAWERM
jgi:DNA processing protein